MFFTSYEFLGFITILFVLYYLVPRKLQWPLLLAASCLFYYAAGPEYLLYILTTGITVYYAARRIEKNLKGQDDYLREHRKELSREERKAYRERQRRLRFRTALACVVFNIGILAVVKYTNFFLSNVNGVLAAFGQTRQFSPVTLILPMGISFYTFQAVGYLIDVYQGTVPAEKNPFKFMLFVSFFPQLIQGPISRYGDLGNSLFEEHSFNAGTVSYGLQRMLWGYFKKLVVADRVLAGVSTIIGDAEAYRGAYVPVGMLLYTLQLYADFTGGIDITIGVAETMGITVKENFERPYFSKSLKEYWRRWHISMCSWFRDYVFYPVSISRPMQKFSRFSRSHFGAAVGRRLPVYVSSFIVWLATGIWHGANWNFIVWGLCNWAVLMISEELEPLYAKFHSAVPFGQSKMYRLFQVGRTFLLVCVLNIFDCYHSLRTTLGLFLSVFTARNWHIFWDGALLDLGLGRLDYALLLLGTALMVKVSLVQRKGSARDEIAKKPYAVRFCIWYGLFLVVLLTGAYGSGYDASQFIYNRF